MPDLPDPLTPIDRVLSTYCAAAAVVRLEADDLDGAREFLADLPAPRLRKLGEVLDRASQLCFDLAHDGAGAVESELSAYLESLRSELAAPVPIAWTSPTLVDFDLSDGAL